MRTDIQLFSFYFIFTDSGFTSGALYIGVYNPAGTPGITDFRYVLDDTPLTYHKVQNFGTLRAIDGCMYVFSEDGGNHVAGEWSDSPCSIGRAAMCEGNKVEICIIY